MAMTHPVNTNTQLRIAVFLSHPIQYFTPLFRALSESRDVTLRVYYFARQGVEHSSDAQFGVSFAWDVDLLTGHDARFLPRHWPTRDPLDATPLGLNAGLVDALREDWDAVLISGYVHLNNWLIAAACQAMQIPVLCWADSNLRAEAHKPRWKLLGKRVLLSVFLPRISAFIACGGSARAYFEHYGVSPEAVFIAPFAIGIARFRRRVRETSREQLAELRARWRIPQGPRIVMFCGKLTAAKRPLDVLRAVQRLGRTDTLAVFVGDGELRAELEQSAPLQAIVTGFINQADMPLVLSLADVLVLSSEYEPYGVVVAEAQALGVPAIVSDACGCHGPGSVLRDGVSGFVYPMGDIERLANHIQQLLDDAGLMARMREQAVRQGDTQSPEVSAKRVLEAVRFALRQQHRVAAPQCR